MGSPVTTRATWEGAFARARANPLVVDAALAVGLTLVSIVIVLGGAQDIGSYEPRSLLLLLLQTVPLVAVHRFPVAVFLVTLSATVAHASLATGSLSTTIGALVALFVVADRRERPVGVAAAVLAGSSIGLLIIGKVGLPAGLAGFVQSELSVGVIWLVGTWSRERRRYIGTVEERADRAEREREERAVRAVGEERERIARELHDVVTHHVSVIVIQAGAGLRALDTRPEDARRALTAIDGSGRQALGDMRRLLGILGRPGAGEQPADAAALAPMPSLDRLGELIEQVRAAGLPVELAVVGDPRPLDPGVELSAYRIIQEALTNTLKHARGARARVELRYEPAALEVHVADEGGAGDGGIGAPGEPGHGLIGMRERVALFGGRFEAGRSGGGYRVVAQLPFEATVTPG